MVYTSDQVYSVLLNYGMVVLSVLLALLLLDIVSYCCLFKVLGIKVWKALIPFHRKDVLAKRYKYNMHFIWSALFPLIAFGYTLVMRDIRKCVAKELKLPGLLRFVFTNFPTLGNFVAYGIWRCDNADIHKGS